jgi:hypothetical protein
MGTMGRGGTLERGTIGTVGTFTGKGGAAGGKGEMVGRRGKMVGRRGDVHYF